MDIKIAFINKQQENFFNEVKRNSCLCGGFGSGKTFGACQKIIFLLTNFNKYRVVIARQTYKDLLQTTFKTFMKICPEEFIVKWDEQKGVMKFKNGSEALWMHLDDANEQTLKGLEINSVYVDQAEEVGEGVYYILDARVGRWDKSVPSRTLLDSNPNWPTNSLGNYSVPSYMLLTPNPDTETHWIWRIYHPDSDESATHSATHSYFEVASTDNPHLSPEIIRTMLSRDPVWVKRFVYGQWGISDATIHKVLPDSILDCSVDFIHNLLRKSNLYRGFDHGESAPACCLWMAVNNGCFYFYREYYQPNQVISYHRRKIAELSENESYRADLADPQIFKKTMQKYGNAWTVAQEYMDESLDAPPIVWFAADNNELSTRNRINELLAINDKITHPINGRKGAPSIYFVRRSDNHSYGVERTITELRTQRRQKLGELNGRPIYSDEREKGVTDHAYDPLRYLIAFHAVGPKEVKKKPSETSFLAARNRFKMLKYHSLYNAYGDLRSRA